MINQHGIHIVNIDETYTWHVIFYILWYNICGDYFQVEGNGESIADMILQDVFEETIGEFGNIEEDEDVDEEAARMVENTATVENILQRLEQMQVCMTSKWMHIICIKQKPWRNN